ALPRACYPYSAPSELRIDVWQQLVSKQQKLNFMCVSSFSRLRVTSCLSLRWALLATAMGVLLSCNNPTTNTDGDKFADHIRTTPHQTPEQQLAGFTLPAGLEISLFAAEPDIGKPINMEFDDRGRLLVTQSSEYPNAAPDGEGHDRITILEDRDGDGVPIVSPT